MMVFWGDDITNKVVSKWALSPGKIQRVNDHNLLKNAAPKCKKVDAH